MPRPSDLSPSPLGWKIRRSGELQGGDRQPAQVPGTRCQSSGTCVHRHLVHRCQVPGTMCQSCDTWRLSCSGLAAPGFLTPPQTPGWPTRCCSPLWTIYESLLTYFHIHNADVRFATLNWSLGTQHWKIYRYTKTWRHQVQIRAKGKSPIAIEMYDTGNPEARLKQKRS